MSRLRPSLFVALAAVLLVCAVPAGAQSPDGPGAARTAKQSGSSAQRRVVKSAPDPTNPTRKKAAKEGDPAKQSPGVRNRAGLPIVFYVAKGEPHSCGPGCSEWIAAEGDLDRGAARRLRAFLNRLGSRKPPIYFHSPGGSVGDAIEIGQLMRARRMTAGVGRTVAEGCDTAGTERACHALKRSGRELAAHFDATRGQCSSACVYALVGAAIRQVPAGAHLGVHASRIVVRVKGDLPVSLNHPALKRLARDRLRANNARLAAYVRAMGIDDGLLEAAQQIKPEQVRFLTRGEIARFGIDTRDVVESAWTSEPSSAAPAVVKLLSDARGTKDYRTAAIRLTCGGKDEIRIAYARERAAGDAPFARPIKAVTRDGEFAFAPEVHKAADTARREFDVRRAHVPFALLHAAAAAGTIEMIEAPDQASQIPPRVTILSTAGLTRLLAALGQRCSGAAASVPTR
jgi:hypothetical protein